jgi:hypothetical protein
MLSHNLKSSASLNVYNPWISSFYLQTCSVKRIGGSREPMARRYLHSTLNPSFGKEGALAMELKFCLFAYFFFIFCKTMTILGAATMRVRKSESTHQQSYGKRI